MKSAKNLTLLLPMILSALACTLITSPVPASPPQSGGAAMAIRVNPTAHPLRLVASTQSQTPKTCHVRIGVPDGRLNVRSCGGTSCPVLAIVHEGDMLTLRSQSVNGWLAVSTASGLTGWVNSKFTNCINEVTK